MSALERAKQLAGQVHRELRAGNTAAARTSLEELVEVSPRHVPARITLGHILRRAGDEKALHHLSVARRLAPGEPAAHFGLASHWIRLGRFDLALPRVMAALLLAPEGLLENLAYHVLDGERHKAGQSGGQSTGQAARLVVLISGNPRWARQSLKHLLSNGFHRFVDSLANLCSLITPDDPEIASIAGRSAWASVMLERARSHLARAARISAHDLNAGFAYLELLCRLEALPAAESEAERLLALDSRQPYTHFLFGRILTQSNRASRAAEHFRIAEQLDPALAKRIRLVKLTATLDDLRAEG